MTMADAPRYPSLFQINSRVWLERLSREKQARRGARLRAEPYRPRPPVAKDSSRLLRPRQRGGVGERAAWEFPWPQHQAAAVSTFLAPGLRFFYDGQRRAPGSECRLISVAARSIRRTRRSLRFMSFCWRY